MLCQKLKIVFQDRTHSLTTSGMVLMMRLFSKKVAVLEVPPARSSIKAEL